MEGHTRKLLGFLYLLGASLYVFTLWKKTGVGLVVVSTLLTLLMRKITKAPQRVRPEDIEAAGGKYVKLKNGCLLEYFEVGQAGHYPVIFLHGGAQTGQSLLAVQGIAEFAKQNRIRFIAPSFPAQGLFDFQPGYTMLDYARDIKQLLDEAKVDKFSVSGWSLGGNCGAAVAWSPELRDRCENVLLMAPARPADYHDPTVSALFRPIFVRLPLLGELGAFGATQNPSQLRNGMAKVNNDNKDLLAPENKEAAGKCLDDVVRSVTWSRAQAFLSLNIVDRPWGFDPIEIKQAQKGRVIISSGLLDEFVPPPHQKSLAKRIPGAKLVEFPTNGHFHWFVHYKSLVLQTLGRN